MQATNAFEKLMCAEAQLDNKWLKEEYIMKSQSLTLIGTKTELNIMSSVADGSQSPFVKVQCNPNKIFNGNIHLLLQKKKCCHNSSFTLVN